VSQTKAELIKGLNINASAPATALQIDASGNVNIDSNTLYVDATNNRVGIGISDPAQSLDIYGSGTSTSQVAAITLRDGNSSSSRRWCISNGAGGNAADLFGKLVIGYGSTVTANPITGTAAVVIDSSGRVGIGATTVQSLLHLSTSGLADLRFTDTGETTDQKNWAFQTGTGIGADTFRLRAINDANNSGDNAYVITKSGASIQTHQWLTGGSERARIDSSGRLLVGTSSASGGALLQVNGGATVGAISTLSGTTGSLALNATATIISGIGAGTVYQVTAMTADSNTDWFLVAYVGGRFGTSLRISQHIASNVDLTSSGTDLLIRNLSSTAVSFGWTALRIK
jgi:hypothetical protein